MDNKKETPPWLEAVDINKLTPEEALAKMGELAEKAKPLREDVPAHGPAMAGAQLRRSQTVRKNLTRK